MLEAEGTAIEACRALAMLPRTPWVLTACCEGKRAAMLVDWVVPCGSDPPLISVIAWKGHPIEPLIRDSHRFGVCELDPADRIMIRRFASTPIPEDPIDPFAGYPLERLLGGAPLLARSRTVLDCDVHRHLDIGSDHEIYVGLVLGGRINGQKIVPRPPPDMDADD